VKEETIVKVAAILNDWNPLGERASSVDRLEGYRTEAIDIIDTYRLMRGNDKIAAVTKQVLEQAFNLNLTQNEVEIPAKKIASVLAP